jgi:hypothetical protein
MGGHGAAPKDFILVAREGRIRRDRLAGDATIGRRVSRFMPTSADTVAIYQIKRNRTSHTLVRFSIDELIWTRLYLLAVWTGFLVA